MKKGIIFDLDGTLWDSSEQVVEAWNTVLDRYGEKNISVADMKSYMGKPLEEIALLMLPARSADEAVRITNECGDYELDYLSMHSGIIFDGVREALEALKNDYSFYIVSNCQDGYIEAFLNGCMMNSYFEDFECIGRTGLPKGENIKLIIERCGLDRAAYIGDTQGDLNSADYAEIPFIHAAYGFGSTDRTTFSISDIRGLIDLIAQVI